MLATDLIYLIVTLVGLAVLVPMIYHHVDVDRVYASLTAFPPQRHMLVLTSPEGLLFGGRERLRVARIAAGSCGIVVAALTCALLSLRLPMSCFSWRSARRSRCLERSRADVFVGNLDVIMLSVALAVALGIGRPSPALGAPAMRGISQFRDPA
jgi:hypothetical protein